MNYSLHPLMVLLLMLVAMVTCRHHSKADIHGGVPMGVPNENCDDASGYNKIVDLEKAVRHADINNDKQIDFDEWCHYLYIRGYSEKKITGQFKEYDVDDDYVLNKDEQQKMHDDLKIQKKKSKEFTWHTQIDWDDSTDEEYTCRGPTQSSDALIKPRKECFKEKDIGKPLHICMDREITYKDKPPVGGPHRPLWPVYGEYIYIPPQRWVHALEHGAAVFLYDPCADPIQLDGFKKLAQECLRKHVITPYRHLADNMYFAVLTYGCRLQMNTVNVHKIVAFVRKHAMRALEARVTGHGHYDLGLLHEAKVVSDLKDSKLCFNYKPLLIEEIMNDLTWTKK